jgi:GNAT superfamily N-acetyltransferase
MSTLPKVIKATPADREACIDIVVAAFIADPLVRWMMPHIPSYLKHAHAAMDAFGGEAVEHGNSFYIEGYKGVVLWLPPGVEQDQEAMEQSMMAGADPSVLPDMMTVMEEVQSYHPHDEPCWYLPTIGVDPAYQGMGLGAALLKESLRAIDEAGEQAFLESSNPANVSLYMRHGFEPLAQCQRGNSPVMTPMLRPAQK